jgi:phage gp36-like protein
MAQTVIKQPAEQLKPNLAFEGAAAISAIVDVSAVKRDLVAGSSNLTIAAELVAGMLFVTLIGGTDGERYLVTGRVEDAGGEIREAELEVVVIDAAWTMPDGGDGYLPISEFVGKFGLEEVVRMTDLAGDGRIDRGLLVNALADAQALTDAYIAGRYSVPLADPPAVVKTAIADMARARLYPRGAPDGVADAAKAAVKLLERIGAGQLPLPALEAPAEAPSSAPIAVSPGARQYPDALRDY